MKIIPASLHLTDPVANTKNNMTDNNCYAMHSNYMQRYNDTSKIYSTGWRTMKKVIANILMHHLLIH